MILPLTPEVLAAAYDYLCELPPFSSWSLPPSDEIKFKVVRKNDCYGYYWRKDGKHNIAISSRLVGRHESLLSSMAHEIIHLHLTEIGTTGDPHGPEFVSLSQDICLIHGWDILNF